MSHQPSFESIPHEVILNCIIPHLSRTDGLAFLSLCRSWRSMLQEIRSIVLSIYGPNEWQIFQDDEVYRHQLLNMLGCFNEQVRNKRKLRVCMSFEQQDSLMYDILRQCAPYIQHIGVKYISSPIYHVDITNPTTESIPSFIEPFQLTLLEAYKLQRLVITEHHEVLNMASLHHENRHMNDIITEFKLSLLQGINGIRFDASSRQCTLRLGYGQPLEQVILDGCDEIIDGLMIQGIKKVILTSCNQLIDVQALMKTEDVTMRFCNRIADISPLRFVQQLTLDDLSGITDISMLGNVPKLTVKLCKNIQCFPIPTGQNQEWEFWRLSISDLTGYEKLEKLILSHCTNIEDISNLGSVKYLEIESCPIDKEKFPIKPLGESQKWTFKKVSVGDISRYSGLDTLEFYYCRDLRNVTDFHNIRLLKFCQCKDLYTVKSLNNITKVSFYLCTMLTSIMDICGVETIEMIFCSNIMVTEAFGNATYLNLHHCDEVRVIPQLRQTKELLLFNMGGLFDISGAENIQKVRLSGCNFISNIAALQNVHNVYIDQCNQLGDVSSLKKVKKLIVKSCPNLTNVNMLDNVEELYIEECPIVEDENSLKIVRKNIHFDNFTLRIASNIWYAMRSRALVIYGHISNWDVSNVTNMKKLFYDKSQFNDNIEFWDVANVEDMSHMFQNLKVFNQPLARWNVSKVRTMQSMFEDAKCFNQPLSTWNTGNVKDMKSTFANCKHFNQPLSKWDISNVEDMTEMFYNASNFSQCLTYWNISHVAEVDNMFDGADKFRSNNQPIDELERL